MDVARSDKSYEWHKGCAAIEEEGQKVDIYQLIEGVR